MAEHTHIEWTDSTWNPITGCSVVSAGCKHCYAMKLAGTRLQHHPSRAGLTIDTKAGPVWNGQVRFNSEWLEQPLQWKRARRIFVCAHGDLFHESVPSDWIDCVFAVMALAPWHTFQVLTKRPARMLRYFERRRDRATATDRLRGALTEAFGYDNPRRPAVNLEHWPLRNVWLGVSVEDQVAADERIPMLLQTPAAVRWISAEPLLGPIDLTSIAPAGLRLPTEGGQAYIDALAFHSEDRYYSSDTRLDWIVVGGESGTGARPMHPTWARSLRDQCTTAGVPFLFKQWGAWAPGSVFPDRIPSGEYCDFDGDLKGDDEFVWHVTKKAAGRQLDGVQHDGYPEAADG
jgi:protein gp37